MDTDTNKIYTRILEDITLSSIQFLHQNLTIHELAYLYLQEFNQLIKQYNTKSLVNQKKPKENQSNEEIQASYLISMFKFILEMECDNNKMDIDKYVESLKVNNEWLKPFKNDNFYVKQYKILLDSRSSSKKMKNNKENSGKHVINFSNEFKINKEKLGKHLQRMNIPEPASFSCREDSGITTLQDAIYLALKFKLCLKSKSFIDMGHFDGYGIYTRQKRKRLYANDETYKHLAHIKQFKKLHIDSNSLVFSLTNKYLQYIRQFHINTKGTGLGFEMLTSHKIQIKDPLTAVWCNLYQTYANHERLLFFKSMLRSRKDKLLVEIKTPSPFMDLNICLKNLLEFMSNPENSPNTQWDIVFYIYPSLYFFQPNIVTRQMITNITNHYLKWLVSSYVALNFYMINQKSALSISKENFVTCSDGNIEKVKEIRKYTMSQIEEVIMINQSFLVQTMKLLKMLNVIQFEQSFSHYFTDLYMEQITSRLPIKNAEHHPVLVLLDNEVRQTDRTEERKRQIKNLENILLSVNIYTRVLLDLFLEQQNNVFHPLESNDVYDTFDERLKSLSAPVRFKFDSEKWLCDSCV